MFGESFIYPDLCALYILIKPDVVPVKSRFRNLEPSDIIETKTPGDLNLREREGRGQYLTISNEGSHAKHCSPRHSTLKLGMCARNEGESSAAASLASCIPCALTSCCTPRASARVLSPRRSRCTRVKPLVDGILRLPHWRHCQGLFMLLSSPFFFFTHSCREQVGLHMKSGR